MWGFCLYVEQIKDKMEFRLQESERGRWKYKERHGDDRRGFRLGDRWLCNYR